MINVVVTVKARSDYDAVFAAIVGDSKNTIEADSYNWTFTGTMTQSDYKDMLQSVTHRMPHYPITIVADGVETVVSYDYDDNDDWIIVNGVRQY